MGNRVEDDHFSVLLKSSSSCQMFIRIQKSTSLIQLSRLISLSVRTFKLQYDSDSLCELKVFISINGRKINLMSCLKIEAL